MRKEGYVADPSHTKLSLLTKRKIRYHHDYDHDIEGWFQHNYEIKRLISRDHLRWFLARAQLAKGLNRENKYRHNNSQTLKQQKPYSLA